MEIESGSTISHSGLLALEEAIEMSKDRLQNEFCILLTVHHVMILGK